MSTPNPWKQQDDSSSGESGGISTVTLGLPEYHYTGNGSTVTFTGADNNSNTLAYSVGLLWVMIDGVEQPATTYTATNGSSVVFGTAPASGSDITIRALTCVTS